MTPPLSPLATRRDRKAAATLADECADPIRLTLPYPPSVNNITAVVRGRKIKSAEGRRYEAAAKAIAVKAGARPIAGDVVVMLSVYRPRRCGDLDNTLKSVLDSMKGLCYADDGQVCRIFASRFEDKANPRVEIMVSKATSEGEIRVTTPPPLTPAEAAEIGTFAGDGIGGVRRSET